MAYAREACYALELLVCSRQLGCDAWLSLFTVVNFAQGDSDMSASERRSWNI